MTNKKPLLSIIIVNWNVADLLLGAVQSIKANPPSVGFEIIVVDNASTDESILKLKQKFPDVKVITNDLNVGFGAANNQGVEIAEGDYIFFLNPDTLVIEDALDQLLMVFDKDSDIGMVGPQLVKNKELENQFGGARLSRTFLSGILLDLIYVERIPFIGSQLAERLRYPYDSKQESYVEVISGAAMMVRTSTFKNLGGFDERFFLAGEDIEICDRFWENGYKVYYFPTAKILHYNQSCTPVDPLTVFNNKFLGIARYYELKLGKNYHFWFRLAAYLILIPKLLAKSLFSFLKRDTVAAKFNLMKINYLIKWRLVINQQ